MSVILSSNKNKLSNKIKLLENEMVLLKVSPQKKQLLYALLLLLLIYLIAIVVSVFTNLNNVNEFLSNPVVFMSDYNWPPLIIKIVVTPLPLFAILLIVVFLPRRQYIFTDMRYIVFNPMGRGIYKVMSFP